MEKILDNILCWLKERFGAKKIVIEQATTDTAKNIELRGYFAITLYNYGGVTVLLNSTHPIPPNSSFTMAAYENHTFTEPLQILFDTSNAFGKNTAVGAGVSYITQKLS